MAASGGFAPGIGVLLLRAGRKIGDQIVSLHARAEDFAVLGVHDEGFGGLRAAIDADQKVSHGAEDSREIKALSRRSRGGRRILHEFALQNFGVVSRVGDYLYVRYFPPSSWRLSFSNTSVIPVRGSSPSPT
ncbi:MAG: hypothetical protein QM813_06850 [Verrucomicrobiota bacterium]